MVMVMLRSRTNAESDTRPDEVHILISLGGDNGYKVFYEKLIQRFNQDSEDIKLVPYYSASDSLAILKLLYSKQANLTYDIACLGAPQITTLIDMELIQPLDQYVMRDLGIGWLNAAPPVRMANAMKNGEIYSLPLFYTNTVLYFNEELITWPPEEITTAELLHLAGEYYGESGQPGLLLAADKLMFDLLTAGERGEMVSVGQREKTLDIRGGVKQQLAQQIQGLLRDGSGINLKTNGIENIQVFTEGRVPLLAGSSCYAKQTQEAAGFPTGVVVLTIDEETDYPMNGNNLYLVNHSGSGETSWTAISRLVEMTDEMMPESYPPNNFSVMAVHQNSKIQRMMEMAIFRMWREDTEMDELMEQLQLQINEVLQEGE